MGRGWVFRPLLGTALRADTVAQVHGFLVQAILLPYQGSPCSHMVDRSLGPPSSLHRCCRDAETARGSAQWPRSSSQLLLMDYSFRPIEIW